MQFDAGDVGAAEVHVFMAIRVMLGPCSGPARVMLGSCKGPARVMYGSCKGPARVMYGSCKGHVRFAYGLRTLKAPLNMSSVKTSSSAL